jgi:hypothetical protein
METEYIYLTPEQLYQVRLVRQWAADQRMKRKAIGESNQYAEELVEDC